MDKSYISNILYSTAKYSGWSTELRKQYLRDLQRTSNNKKIGIGWDQDQFEKGFSLIEKADPNFMLFKKIQFEHELFNEKAYGIYALPNSVKSKQAEFLKLPPKPYSGDVEQDGIIARYIKGNSVQIVMVKNANRPNQSSLSEENLGSELWKQVEDQLRKKLKLEYMTDLKAWFIRPHRFISIAEYDFGSNKITTSVNVLKEGETGHRDDKEVREDTKQILQETLKEVCEEAEAIDNVQQILSAPKINRQFREAIIDGQTGFFTIPIKYQIGPTGVFVVDEQLTDLFTNSSKLNDVLTDLTEHLNKGNQFADFLANHAQYDAQNANGAAALLGSNNFEVTGGNFVSFFLVPAGPNPPMYARIVEQNGVKKELNAVRFIFDERTQFFKLQSGHLSQKAYEELFKTIYANC